MTVPGKTAKLLRKRVERVKGIEPSSQAWEAHILPLNHTRTGKTDYENVIAEERGRNGGVGGTIGRACTLSPDAPLFRSLRGRNDPRGAVTFSFGASVIWGCHPSPAGLTQRADLQRIRIAPSGAPETPEIPPWIPRALWIPRNPASPADAGTGTPCIRRRSARHRPAGRPTL
ncbi:MAG: hypothetical protein RIS24_1405 [Verrucomicrobiota bacterium]